MRTGKSIIGLKIVSQDAAEELGYVKDLVFDDRSNNLLALLVSEKELFGLIQAQIVPWREIRSIGHDAVMVGGHSSKMLAGDDPAVKAVMGRQTALSGTRIMTTDGKELGTLADMCIDESSGAIVGYQISTGFFSDTLRGKTFLPASPDLTLTDNHVALVSPEAAAKISPAPTTPFTDGSATRKIASALDSATDKISDAYRGIANASVEKQKAWVVGKNAGRDVILPTGINQSGMIEAGVAESDITEPGARATGSQEIDSDGNLVDGQLLVRRGEQITALHADRAADAGELHSLVLAAGAGAASGTEDGPLSNLAERTHGLGERLHVHTHKATIGKPVGHDVFAPDGSLIVAQGELVTEEIYEQAIAVGREPDLVAAAFSGATSERLDTARERAGVLWDALKHRTAELTGHSPEQKEEEARQAEQQQIDDALGRTVDRVVLSRDDVVIVKPGELITNSSIEQARAGGVLQILLSSVDRDGKPAVPANTAATATPATATSQAPSTVDGHTENAIVPVVETEKRAVIVESSSP